MNLGGWSESGDCAATCDGPLPSDPDWTSFVDAHGCTLWSNPGKGGKCGANDAGMDSSADGAADSHADAVAE